MYGIQFGETPYSGLSGSSSIAYTKSFSETITATDGIIEAISKLLAEIITPSDIINRNETREFLETATMTEVFSETTGSNKSLNDTVTITDSIVRSITRLFNEFMCGSNYPI